MKILLKSFFDNKKIIFIILNKIDLISKNDLITKIGFINKKYNLENIFPISSKNIYWN